MSKLIIKYSENTNKNRASQRTFVLGNISAAKSSGTIIGCVTAQGWHMANISTLREHSYSLLSPCKLTQHSSWRAQWEHGPKSHTHTAHFNYTHDQSFSPHGVVVIICAKNSSVGHHWHLLKETQRRIRSPTEKATVWLPNGSRILTHNPVGYTQRRLLTQTTNHKVSTGAFVRTRLSNPVRNHLADVQFSVAQL